MEFRQRFGCKSKFVDIKMSVITPSGLKSVAQVFHALADATRLEIIEHLSHGEQCVCDLTDILETGQSRLSFHLKILKEAGIVDSRRDGRWIYYTSNRSFS